MAIDAVPNLMTSTPHTLSAPSGDVAVIRRIKAIVLLAGSVRPSELSRGVGRSLLDLPVEAGASVLSLWSVQAESLAELASLQALPLRVIINRSAPEPTVPARPSRVPITVERDAADFRGTGGILRDAAAQYAPDDFMLVGNGAQVLTEPLSRLASELLASSGSVSIIAHGDGTPSGLFLIRCSVLSTAADVGFLDFKEQLLPRLAAEGHAINVIRHDHATGRPVRTLDGYLAGIRAFHRMKKGLPPVQDSFDEDWTRTFSVVEAGANVDASATVHDSVVLSGARIERGAASVRCVVCPGAVVRAGQTVADRILTESGDHGPRRSS